MLNYHKTIKKIFSSIIKIAFPKTCFICNKIISDGYFCTDDWNKIRFLQKPACDICFQPFLCEPEFEGLCGQCLIKRPAYFKAISIIKYDQNSENSKT